MHWTSDTTCRLPFDDLRRTWDRFFADRTIPHTLVDSTDGSRGGILKQAMAVPALFDAAEQRACRWRGRSAAAAMVRA